MGNGHLLLKIILLKKMKSSVFSKHISCEISACASLCFGGWSRAVRTDIVPAFRNHLCLFGKEVLGLTPKEAGRGELCGKQDGKTLLLDTEEASARHTYACQIPVRHTQLTEKFDHQDGNMESRNLKYVSVFNTPEVTRINLVGTLSGQR